MEKDNINQLLKEALSEHAIKNDIVREVPYDDCMGEDGKISIWKSLKSYWNPKNWFNYSGYATREKYWKTILGNIILSMIIGVVGAILMVAFGKLGGAGTSFATSGLLALSIFFLPFTICNTIATISLMMKRANCAGVSKNLVWGGYVVPTILSLFLGGIFSLIGFCFFIYIGVVENKYLTYRKISAFDVISDNDIKEKEEEFFNKK